MENLRNSNLVQYCRAVSSEAEGNIQTMAELLMQAADFGSSWEQKYAWDLLRLAGHPFHSKQSFLRAAMLAAELINEDDGSEPPEAA